MPEEYAGTKFKTVFDRKDLPQDPRLDDLIRWCRRFAELELAPGGSGNMSVRSSAEGFIVSRTAGNLGSITKKEFVQVLKADMKRRELTVSGIYEPSSESMMHAAIYEARPGINAIFHGHSDRILAASEKLGLPLTKHEQPYGTPELVAEVLKILDQHDFFVIRNHGFVSLGKTIAQAGRLAKDILKKT